MTDLIKVEKQGHILTIGLNRPDKKNALDTEMFQGLSAAYAQLCDDKNLRCGVLYSTADIFSAGLDLMAMAPTLMGQPGDDAPVMTAEDQVDPFNWASVSGKIGRQRNTPLIAAVNSRCYAGGLELALGTDVVVAEEDATFAQAEVRRGLIPMGGAIERFVTRFGWGNAMQWLLSGDPFDVNEAHRIGLVQRITPTGKAFETAMELAERIASAAPIAVGGVLENAYLALDQGQSAAAKHMMPFMLGNVAPSKDLQEGIASLMQKRDPAFAGE